MEEALQESLNWLSECLIFINKVKDKKLRKEKMELTLCLQAYITKVQKMSKPISYSVRLHHGSDEEETYNDVVVNEDDDDDTYDDIHGKTEKSSGNGSSAVPSHSPNKTSVASTFNEDHFSSLKSMLNAKVKKILKSGSEPPSPLHAKRNESSGTNNNHDDSQTRPTVDEEVYDDVDADAKSKASTKPSVLSTKEEYFNSMSKKLSNKFKKMRKNGSESSSPLHGKRNESSGTNEMYDDVETRHAGDDEEVYDDVLVGVSNEASVKSPTLSSKEDYLNPTSREWEFRKMQNSGSRPSSPLPVIPNESNEAEENYDDVQTRHASDDDEVYDEVEGGVGNKEFQKKQNVGFGESSRPPVNLTVTETDDVYEDCETALPESKSKNDHHSNASSPSALNRDLPDLPVPSLPPKSSNMRSPNSPRLSPKSFFPPSPSRASTPVAPTRPPKTDNKVSRVASLNQKPNRQFQHEETPNEQDEIDCAFSDDFDFARDEELYKNIIIEDLYQGMWDCNADENNELSFRRGQIVHIISKEYDSSGWWIAKRQNDVGFVPKNYLIEAYETHSDVTTIF